jgi:hypothetical protein
MKDGGRETFAVYRDGADYVRCVLLADELAGGMKE